ncbi:MAG TPA: hypothetical protein DD727_09050, partial [Clostridiales bacterium]|nr:hypothetical protein [Clostridiales bacterium]
MNRPDRISKPNILFIMTDEHRADTLGCYGTSWAKTPHIDDLANRGILFENHFVNSPQCVPSRTSMLSGVYPHQAGIYDNKAIHQSWPEGLVSFPQILSRNGYHTANIGKIHYPRNEDMWDENHVFVEFPEVANPYRLGPGYDEKEYEVIHRHHEKDIILSGKYPNF